MNNRLRALLVLLFAQYVLAFPVAALEYLPQRTNEISYIVVTGDFVPNEDFSGFLNSVRNTGASVVVFDSPGGNPYAAMELGRLIRSNNMKTIQVRRLDCASACALAFLGGVERWAEPGSIGVHRSSFNASATIGRDEAVAGVQEGTADILAYLREMGIDPAFLELALRHDQSDMRYLTASEMQTLRVTNLHEADDRNVGIGQGQGMASARQSDSIERVALSFVQGLIEEHGNDTSAALSSVLAFYADTVNYYGKLTTLSDVIKDKQAYFRRWPERAYKIRDGSVMVTCANSTCMVSGIYDWFVRSVPRNRQAKGVARFNYAIQLGNNPEITAEGGEVIR